MYRSAQGRGKVGSGGGAKGRLGQVLGRITEMSERREGIGAPFTVLCEPMIMLDQYGAELTLITTMNAGWRPMANSAGRAAPIKEPTNTTNMLATARPWL